MYTVEKPLAEIETDTSVIRNDHLKRSKKKIHPTANKNGQNRCEKL